MSSTMVRKTNKNHFHFGTIHRFQVEFRSTNFVYQVSYLLMNTLIHFDRKQNPPPESLGLLDEGKQSHWRG